MKTYVLEGLSVFRSKGCIVGVVVDGVEGVCKLQWLSSGQSTERLTMVMIRIEQDIQWESNRSTLAQGGLRIFLHLPPAPTSLVYANGKDWQLAGRHLRF